MAERERIEVSEIGDITRVNFRDRKILDPGNIESLGEELFALVEQDGRKSLLLDFTNVEFLSSAALNKLILLDKKIKAANGRLKICSLRPEIRNVFVITSLHQLFEIKENEKEAIASF
jgi:anti-sigma B factor antagonist